ncbi:CHAT domain-containing protein [Archangium violaceum]|uniref:CHAT domain-containing protein n=1 Tax=Archangium violaceum TaxID=83451 RepID=UPI00195103C6|nr:CHAT domain-containing protein [Archangium violaceum]QRN97835.1 CHAT domain-containing protein [Archangium violaceum]
MGATRYHRSDLRIVFRPREDGGFVARVRVGRELREYGFEPRTAALWGRGLPSALELSLALGLDEALESLVAADSEARLLDETGTSRFLPRVVLDIQDARLASIDWETPLREWMPDVQVVRASPVRPRAERIPLTLPLRIVEVGGGPRRAPRTQRPGIVRELVSQVFRATTGWERAVEVGRCETPESLASFREDSGWRTAEVLHFQGQPRIARELTSVLSTASPDEPGTLGWLLRLTDSWQTRLVVIEDDSWPGVLLRRLAQALVERGGPAVLLALRASGDWRQRLYEGLVHDMPLDAIRQEPGLSLFVGAGREELLRVSSIAESLTRPEVAEDLVRELEARNRIEPRALPGLRRMLERMKGQLDGWVFDQHEREGVLPLSQELASLRGRLKVPRLSTPGSWSLESFLGPETSPESPRHVNALLHEEGADGRPRLLAPGPTRLTPGEVVHLGVQLGPRDELVRNIGTSALLEEALHWTVGAEGLFLEVGVTGMDFDVLGDPVQELWLPRTGASDAVFFALTPRADTRIEGVARLRLCLYQKGNLVQSFRLAALVRRPGEEEPDRNERARRLACALDVDVAQVLQAGDVGYLTRLEYGAGGALWSLPALPPRALSFTVNQSAGQEVVTVKGQDLFEVRVGGNLADVVRRLRDALTSASTDAAGNYRFIHQERPNQGDPAHFDTVMRELARHGWDLFTQLVPTNKARARVGSALEADFQVIHAAHVHLENVIPWALVYDRYYDADNQGDAHATCLAALPGADGAPGARECGEHPSCPLHPSRVAEGYSEDTVVCPRHFWGFRHIVEVPPEQVRGLEEIPPEPASAVACSRPVQLVLGQHGGLLLASTHAEELEVALRATPLPAVIARAADRDSLLKTLKVEPPPDIVYLYCHARAQGQPGDDARAPKEPHLELGPQGKLGWITASQVVGPEWPHRPLVFLNGCGTAAFDATQPAQLILNLMARGAGGVIGTEVTIWEALAAEVALRFFKAFLGQRPAGEALLVARRALLGKYNPLGLVYTLYGHAELKLRPGTS